MSFPCKKLKDISHITTGKLDSNAAVHDGRYPFFTCDPVTLAIDTWAYDTEAILLAGNNASGNYTAKYYSGKFNAYQRTYIIESIDKQVLNVRYLGYAMNQQLRLLKTMSSGSTTKFLTIKMLHALDIPMPSIETQHRIASILSAYDDLIENNRKQIKLLEEAAQRLYKEWFVDLRFPGHENVAVVDGVPEGWRTGTISNIADINRDSISKSYPLGYIDYIDLSAVNKGVVSASTRYTLAEAPGRAKRCVNDGDIIWGMVRPNLRSYALILHPTESTVVSTGFAVLHAKMVPFSFLYCLVTQDSYVGYLINCTNGAAYPAVKPNHFSESMVLIPDCDVLNAFHAQTEPLFRKIEILQKENSRLSEARDRLLPKLMSGEVEV